MSVINGFANHAGYADDNKMKLMLNQLNQNLLAESSAQEGGYDEDKQLSALNHISQETAYKHYLDDENFDKINDVYQAPPSINSNKNFSYFQFSQGGMNEIESTIPSLGHRLKKQPISPLVQSVFFLNQVFFDKFTKEHPDHRSDYSAIVEGFTNPALRDCIGQKLDIKLSLEKINAVLTDTGLLQLRHIDENYKTLIIGCGNEQDCDFEEDCSDLDFVSPSNFQKGHVHLNEITINSDISWNPSIVGVWGAQKFPMIQSGQLDKIVFEESFESTNVAKEELKRILSLNGQVIFKD